MSRAWQMRRNAQIGCDAAEQGEEQPSELLHRAWRYEARLREAARERPSLAEAEARAAVWKARFFEWQKRLSQIRSNGALMRTLHAQKQDELAELRASAKECGRRVEAAKRKKAFFEHRAKMYHRALLAVDQKAKEGELFT